MEGFKANPKMKSDLPCFKAGGFVSKQAPKMKAQPKAEQKMVAKPKAPSAASIKEKEAPTEVVMKKGGRCKKDGGTVRKYKAGGDVAEKKKASGNKDKTKKSAAVEGYALGGNIPAPNAQAMANANPNARFMRPQAAAAVQPGTEGFDGRVNLDQFENQNRMAAGDNANMPMQNPGAMMMPAQATQNAQIPFANLSEQALRMNPMVAPTAQGTTSQLPAQAAQNAAPQLPANIPSQAMQRNPFFRGR